MVGENLSLPCSIIDLIPHQGKMSFDQNLIKAKTDDGESSTIINAANIFLADNNHLSNMVLIEYINQLNAAIQGYNGKYNQKKPQKGLFVGLQEVEFLQPVHLGDLLTIKAFKTEEVAQVTFIQGIIYRADERIAALVTKLYEVKDSAEFDLLINQGQIPQSKNELKLNNQQPPVYLGSRMHRKLYTYLHDTIIGADFIAFTIACPDDFEAFDGHFPGNPILPGVILLEIGQLALGLLLQQAVIIKHLKKMKISGVVLPNQDISGTIKIEPENGPLRSFSAIFKDREAREISRYSGYCNEGKEA